MKIKLLLWSVLFALHGLTTFAATPTITSFSPSSGPVGTLVTINGNNLDNPSSFSIGGKAAIVISNSGSKLIAMIMPGAVTGTVAITTVNGTFSYSHNFTITTTPFPSKLEAGTLTGANLTDFPVPGSGVAISADGNTAVIGGRNDNNNQGAIWIYTRSGSGWVAQGTKLVGSGNIGPAGQGVSLGISADGNTVIVGGYQDNDSQGAAWIFVRKNANWSQQGDKLVGVGNVGPAQQGYSVAISADGNTAIVGGHNDNNKLGAAWMFSRNAGTWSQLGSKLVGGGSVGTPSQGCSVAISADGNTTIVGGAYDNNENGAAWVFVHNGNAFIQQGAKLIGGGNDPSPTQGYSVALSADGNTAIVGGYLDFVSKGAAWIYTRSGENWVQQGEKLIGTGGSGVEHQGTSVSISADGNTAIVGGLNDWGAIWVYTRNKGIWLQHGDRLLGPGIHNSTSRMLGFSVAMTSDGKKAIVNGQDYNSQTLAWTFTDETTISSSPNITYKSPQIFKAGVPIEPLQPINTGGTVPATPIIEVSTIAGSGAYGSADGAGTAASFYSPQAIATDTLGNLYVIDGSTNLVRKINSGGDVITLAGNGKQGSTNGQGTSASFLSPTGIVTDSHRNVFVADYQNNLVRKITPSGLVSTFAGNGDLKDIDGTGLAASFKGPFAIAIDLNDNLYISEAYAYLIRKITPNGVVTTFTGPGPVAGAGKSFGLLFGLTCDVKGNIYAADNLNNLIRKFSSTGVMNVVAGSGVQGSSDGVGSAASFNSPYALTLDIQGNLYVADAGNNLIRKVAPNGAVTTVAGTGIKGAANGFGNVASFNFPTGIALDNQNNLYIADDANNIIRKITSTGFTISPMLPPGLAFDNNNGSINGTPVSSSPYTKYTINAYNAAGNSTTYLYLAVLPRQVPTPAKNAITNSSHQAIAAEPIQLATGTYEYNHDDFTVPIINNSLIFTRFYNSLNSSKNSALGYGWAHSYDYHINIQKDSIKNIDTLWDVQYPDGHIASFVPLNDGTGRAVPLFTGIKDSLRNDSTGSFILYTKDNYQYHFTSIGLLDKISDINDNITLLKYTGNNLISITGQGGRSFTISYTGSNISSVTDPLNRNCSFTYDSNGNLQTSKDANGGAITFTYDNKHQMVSAINPLGEVIAINSYDATGKVTKQLDAYNQPTVISYNTPNINDVTVTNPDNSQFIAHHDSSFRKTFIIDELGFKKIYIYDAYDNENGYTDENGQITTRQLDKLGNLLTNNQPGNVTTKIVYNAFNSPTQITDANGNVTTYSYDSHNNPLIIHHPDNTYEYFTYYANGLKATYKDGRGNIKTYTYSPQGDLTTIVASNGTISYGYDAAGRRISITDENNNTSKFVYDNNDNVINVTDALSHSIVSTYDSNNQLLSMSDKNGNSTSYSYDKKGRLISTSNPNGAVSKRTYDVRDNLLSVTDPNNSVTSYSYDQKNRKISVTNGLGTAQNKYDGVGNLTEVIDGTNKNKNYTYTPTYKIKTVSDGLSNITSYTYDKNDNLLGVTDPLNKKTAYTYDSMNRLNSVLDAANNSTKITYDENGNKKTINDPKGHIQTFTYDAVNRLTAFKDAEGNIETYGYDGSGNITSVTKATGSIVKVYDAVNRLLTVTNSTGDNYSYFYDNNANITKMVSNIGASFLEYDKLNQLTQYTDPYDKKVQFAYDAGGNKQSITYPGGKSVTYFYDNANNLKKVNDWLTHSFNYSYDAAGRMTQLLYPNGVHCDYIFDAAGRLISNKSGLTGSSALTGSSYVLDATGNRISEQKIGPVPSNLKPLTKIYGYGNDDRLLNDSTWIYSNDNAGNRLTETKGKSKISYQFSVDNRLTKITDTSGIVSAFFYDAVGRRLSRSVGNNTNRYVIDVTGGLPQVLQITDANGVIKSQYIYGIGLLARVDSIGHELYYQYDGQHNTVALTDENSLVTDTYTYDPFGIMILHNGDTNQQFTFLGEFGVEKESPSIYYDRARYYDAVNGRFISKDQYVSSILNPQTINRYSYAANNPLTGFDYNGLFRSQDDSGFLRNYSSSSSTSIGDNVNSINDVYNNVTATNAYAIISTVVSYGLDKFGGKVGGVIGDVFSGASYINAGINIGNDIADYKNHRSTLLNTSFSIIHEGASLAVGELSGKTGVFGYGVGLTYHFVDKYLPDYLVHTHQGDRFTSWLAKNNIY